jgi:hypothetical protein
MHLLGQRRIATLAEIFPGRSWNRSCLSAPSTSGAGAAAECDGRPGQSGISSQLRKAVGVAPHRLAGWSVTTGDRSWRRRRRVSRSLEGSGRGEIYRDPSLGGEIRQLRSGHETMPYRFPSRVRKEAYPGRDRSLARSGVLFVGEDDSFLRQGGMINLVREHGRIRFEVNSDALDRSQIHFSSKILSLAKADYGSSGSGAIELAIASVGSRRRLQRSSPPTTPRSPNG